MSQWHIYQKTKEPHDKINDLPPPPKWRQFDGEIIEERTLQKDHRAERRLGGLSRGLTFEPGDMEVEMVNAALYLRRPLLVTGKPGTGKSSLAFSVAHQLKLGNVLYWPITTRATLQDGLYRYDAIGRLQDFQLLRLKWTDQQKELPDIGKFIRLGPLGTALLPSKRPRVLLIDEIDKSDIDLPNDLLNIFEEGEFEIPELSRLSEENEKVKVFPSDSNERVSIVKGRVRCHEFPFIVLTSNAERELPAPFLRRCLRLDIAPPTPEKLQKIVDAHFGKQDENGSKERKLLIENFLNRREKGDLATDQLLNAIYLILQGIEFDVDSQDKTSLINIVLRHLNTMGTV